MYHMTHILYIIDLARLTRKEIKQVLALCGLRFKDWVAARRTSKDGEIMEKEQRCKVCLDNMIDSVFLPCGHMMTCIICGSNLVSWLGVSCPICRKQIARVAKIYRA